MRSPARGRLGCRVGWRSACGWGRACQHRPARSLHPGRGGRTRLPPRGLVGPSQAPAGVRSAGRRRPRRRRVACPAASVAVRLAVFGRRTWAMIAAGPCSARMSRNLDQSSRPKRSTRRVAPSLSTATAWRAHHLRPWPSGAPFRQRSRYRGRSGWARPATRAGSSAADEVGAYGDGVVEDQGGGVGVGMLGSSKPRLKMTRGQSKLAGH
jgi:hypothetical protein